jgi:phage replication O-like protein O
MKIQTPNYTQIPNSLLDSDIIKTPAAFRVMIAICRKTYGYHKKKDKIAISQLAKMTGLSNRSIMRSLIELEDLELVILTKREGKTSEIQINMTGDKFTQVPVTNLHRQNKVLNKVDTISQPKVDDAKEDFDLDKYIGKMLGDKNRLIRIIGAYLEAKNEEKDLTVEINSYESMNLVIKENLRHAQKLKDLPSEQILRLFEKAKEKSKHGRDFDWKLSTLPKLMA